MPEPVVVAVVIWSVFGFATHFAVPALSQPRNYPDNPPDGICLYPEDVLCEIVILPDVVIGPPLADKAPLALISTLVTVPLLLSFPQ